MIVCSVIDLVTANVIQGAFTGVNVDMIGVHHAKRLRMKRVSNDECCALMRQARYLNQDAATST